MTDQKTQTHRIPVTRPNFRFGISLLALASPCLVQVVVDAGTGILHGNQLTAGAVVVPAQHGGLRRVALLDDHVQRPGEIAHEAPAGVFNLQGRVLLADDSPANLMVGVGMLERL